MGLPLISARGQVPKDIGSASLSLTKSYVREETMTSLSSKVASTPGN